MRRRQQNEPIPHSKRFSAAHFAGTLSRRQRMATANESTAFELPDPLSYSGGKPTKRTEVLRSLGWPADLLPMNRRAVAA